jgi:hypothetical protein
MGFEVGDKSSRKDHPGSPMFFNFTLEPGLS